MTKEQVKEFLDAAHKEYIKVYEERFQKVARKAFLDGCMAMSTFTDADGDYKFEWEQDTFKVIKLANDIDNATGFPLSLNEYQEKAMSTCMKSCDNFSYMILNLVGEVGELAGKVAKDIRKRQVLIGDIDNELTPSMPCEEWEARNAEYMHEAGDVLWQLSGLCMVMGWNLEDVAKANLSKLASRKQRGVIDGEGDNR